MSVTIYKYFPNVAPSQHSQHSTHYIDQTLQKWFLVALVILEVLILAGLVPFFIQAQCGS